MEDDPTTSSDNILNTLLNSTSAEAMQAGMLLQNQSFGFVVGQLSGFLGNFFASIFDDEYLQTQSPLDAVLDIVQGVIQGIDVVNVLALPLEFDADNLTVGGLNGARSLMEDFFATNPDLSFLADIVTNPLFRANANQAAISIVEAANNGNLGLFQSALDIATAFFDGFDPTALAFAAIAANAPAVINAETRDDNTEDPVSPDDPTNPDDPPPPDVPDDNSEDPVAPDDPATPPDNTGDDALSGDGGANNLDGGDGNDDIIGGGGRDTLKGGAGRDTLDGGRGADEMSGGTGADKMSGGGGRDNMSGGGGKDTMEGGGGRDQMSGNGGADDMNGGGGRDVVEGGGGRDTLDGGGGRDMIKGGGGRDEIAGGGGRDTLEGGGGRDTFWFNVGDRNDTITDFNSRKDKIIVNDPERAGLILTAEELALQVLFGEDGEEDVLVTILGSRGSPRDTVIRLEDTKLSDVNTDAFEFGNMDGELGDGDPIL